MEKCTTYTILSNFYCTSSHHCRIVTYDLVSLFPVLRMQLTSTWCRCFLLCLAVFTSLPKIKAGTQRPPWRKCVREKTWALAVVLCAHPHTLTERPESVLCARPHTLRKKAVSVSQCKNLDLKRLKWLVLKVGSLRRSQGVLDGIPSIIC